jgi:hypothetical protein
MNIRLPPQQPIEAVVGVVVLAVACVALVIPGMLWVWYAQVRARYQHRWWSTPYCAVAVPRLWSLYPLAIDKVLQAWVCTVVQITQPLYGRVYGLFGPVGPVK